MSNIKNAIIRLKGGAEIVVTTKENEMAKDKDSCNSVTYITINCGGCQTTPSNGDDESEDTVVEELVTEKTDNSLISGGNITIKKQK